MFSFGPQWVRWDPLTWGRPLAAGLSLRTDLSIHLKKQTNKNVTDTETPRNHLESYPSSTWAFNDPCNSQVVTHPSHWENLCLHSSVVPM